MKKLKVLGIDDDHINMMLLKLLLKKNENVGEILTGNNGEEGMEVLSNVKDVDLILLDMMMPKMNGLVFLEKKAMMEDIKDIPVIVLTTDESLKNEAMDKGAFQFLTKPIREKELYEKIAIVSSVL